MSSRQPRCLSPTRAPPSGSEAVLLPQPRVHATTEPQGGVVSLYLIALAPVADIQLLALGQPHLDGVGDPNVLQFLQGRIRMPRVGVPQLLPARTVAEGRVGGSREVPMSPGQDRHRHPPPRQVLPKTSTAPLPRGCPEQGPGRGGQKAPIHGPGPERGQGRRAGGSQAGGTVGSQGSLKHRAPAGGQRLRAEGDWSSLEPTRSHGQADHPMGRNGPELCRAQRTTPAVTLPPRAPSPTTPRERILCLW